MRNLTDTIEEIFPQKTVVIVGDLVADQFLNGTISRVSREAPVFILRHDTTATVPGSAANAAVNVASLGGKTILIGLAGTDPSGELLIAALTDAGLASGGIVVDPAVTTTTKLRVLAGQHYAARQQVIRIDYEPAAEVDAELKIKLRDNLAAAAGEADAIIISDYNYGAVFPEIFADALAISRERGIPLIVDSRFALERFENATSATPNRDEVEHILGEHFTADDCENLRARLGLKTLLVTNGNQGMELFEEGLAVLQIDAVGGAEPVDVTGAGDTVIAAYALGLASGLSFADAARIANHAGGIVVMKKGTASVTANELLASITENAGTAAANQA
ncbi:MAG: bifunctional heptose 7-phosphate kinase/heptose 1-phosphate adenyltransferase [Pyrinomonadaceae bacterium]